MLRSIAFLVALAAASPARAASWPDLSSPPPPQGGGENDAALIVGIERYSDVPAIPGAVQNADDWFAYLTKTLKVPAARVTLLRNKEGTVEKLRKYAAEAAANVKPGGTVWFVFIGHGAPAKDGKDGVLVGYDAQQDADSLYARSVPQKELLGLLGAGKQARTVAVLDACFSGRTAAGELVKGLQPLIVAKGAVNLSHAAILTAGQADQFAGPLPDANRPAFSYLVLGALRGWGDRDADGKVTVGEAHVYAKETLQAVVKDRTQIPELTGALEGDVLARGTELGPDVASMVLARRAPSGGSELTFGGALDIRIPKIEVTSVSGLKDINMQAEQELERALDTEENKTARPEDKSAAWCRLAAVEGNNPYAVKAREGCRTWRVYAKALRKQENALAEDFHTLAGYLRLKRKSHEQKVAAVGAFLAAYRAFGETDKVKRAAEAKTALLSGAEAELPDETAAYEQACAAGDGQRCQILGGMHTRGIWPFTRDEAKGLELFQKACDSGYASGCSDLAAMYADGRGVSADPRRAQEFYAKACDANDGSGCNGLAEMFLRGRGGSPDVPRAAEFFQRSCDDGDAVGCLRIADMTATGQGVGADDRRAAALYERACDGGASEGCSHLADLYADGKGVPRDQEKARSLHERTCSGGVSKSCLRVGELLERTDRAKAVSFYGRGCELGLGPSCDKQRTLQALMAKDEQDRQAAQAAQLRREQEEKESRSSRARLFRGIGYGFVGVGLAVGVLGGGGLQYTAHGKIDEIRNGQATDIEETFHDAEDFQNLAIGAGIAGGVLAAIGVPFILLNQDPAAPQVAFSPTAHGGVLSVSGSF